jgi:hypothetical protein
LAGKARGKQRVSAWKILSRVDERATKEIFLSRRRQAVWTKKASQDFHSFPCFRWDKSEKVEVAEAALSGFTRFPAVEIKVSEVRLRRSQSENLAKHEKAAKCVK